MVDLANRDDREARLARRLAQAGRAARDILEAAIADGFVSEDEWQRIAEAYAQPLMAELETTFYVAMEQSAIETGAGFDVDLANQEAIAWARNYTYELVRQIDASQRSLLQASIGDYFQRRMTLGDLQDRIARAFGPARAATISITETTRAASAAEQAQAARLRAFGLKPVMVWVTSRDAKVCPVCGPRDGTRQNDGWLDPPPAHPRCRCWVRLELVDE